MRHKARITALEKRSEAQDGKTDVIPGPIYVDYHTDPPTVVGKRPDVLVTDEQPRYIDYREGFISGALEPV